MLPRTTQHDLALGLTTHLFLLLYKKNRQAFVQFFLTALSISTTR
jgi:hypothetical protein